MIQWPDALVDDIARRRAILFLGAGVSLNSVSPGGYRPPTWEEFLRAGVEKCTNPKQHIQSLLKQRDFLTACEVIKHKLGREWDDLLDEYFVHPRYKPAEIHEHIFKLDARMVLTQNIDKIYDTYAQNESGNTVAIKQYHDADVARVARGRQRAVIKAHGSIDNRDGLIFTREDYAKTRHVYESFYRLLDALVLTHTFVFMGCGANDPDAQLMLERHANQFPYGRCHYMCAPANHFHADVRESMKRNYNIEILRYNPNNRHTELTQSLADLVNRVDEKKAKLSETQEW